MRRSLFTACFFLLSACMANRGLGTASAAEVNRYRLHQVCLGMREEEVFQIMRYPAIDEQIVTKDACYDIWFYVTRSTALGQSELVPHNLTPLIFKDSVLVARGYDYYNYLLAKQKKEEASSSSVSMSSKPAKKEKSETPSDREKQDSDEEKPYRRDPEDDRMIEQEQEQNFNYW